MEGKKVNIKFFSELSEADQHTYETLRQYLAEPINKNKRNKSVETFAANLQAIKNFVVRGDADDWKRAYVCGICWIGDAIAINTRNLRVLTAKCKSSINGLFQSMGYGTAPQGSETGAAVVHYFPVLRGNYTESRQWTVRKKVAMTPPADLMHIFAPEAQEFISPPPDVHGNDAGVAGLSIRDDLTMPDMEPDQIDWGFAAGLLDQDHDFGFEEGD